MLRKGTVVGLAGLAGCAAPRADLTSRRRTAHVPEPGAPTYRTWVPAQSDREPGADPGSVAVRYVDVPRALDRGGTLPAGIAGSLFEFWAYGDWFGHAVDDLDGILVFSTSPLTVVFAGDVSVDDAADGLEAGGYESLASDDPWTLYARLDQPRVVGVSSAGVVQAELSGRSDAAVGEGVDRVRSILEAHAGDRERRHERKAAFERITDRLGRSVRTSVPLERPAWLPEGGAWGSAVDATDDGFVRRATVAIPPGDRNGRGRTGGAGHPGGDEPGSIEESLAEEIERAWGGEPTVYADAAGIEGVVSSTAADPIGDVADAVPPRATIAFEYDEDGRTATVSHLAGEPIERPRLVIAVDGHTNDALRFEDGTLEPGDRFNIRELPGDVVVSFRYELESGGDVTLGQFAGSRAPSA